MFPATAAEANFVLYTALSAHAVTIGQLDASRLRAGVRMHAVVAYCNTYHKHCQIAVLNGSMTDCALHRASKGTWLDFTC